MRNKNTVVKAIDNSRQIAMFRMFGVITFATLFIHLAMIAGALAVM